MASFFDLFTKRHDSSAIFDLDLWTGDVEKVYLKEIALNTVVNFVARTIAQSDFRIYDKKGLVTDHTSYLLNVKPNPNQSASIFWQKLIYQLLTENEALVVSPDNKNLFVADSFTLKSDIALYKKTFNNIKIGTLTVDKTFDMDKVWYLKYSNKELKTYIANLNESIGSLYSRMVETAKRNNQIRALVNIDMTIAGTDEDMRTKMQNFIDKTYKAVKEKSVALIPQTKGFEYKEVSNSEGVGKENISDLKGLQNQLIDNIAGIIGVPPALIYGQNEKLDSNIKSFLDFCIKPIIKMIQDELNAKLFSEKEYKDGKHVNVIGLNKRDMFEVADKVDKLISSSVLTKNEVRHEIGYESVKGGDAFILTKNYQNDLKGGDNNDDN